MAPPVVVGYTQIVSSLKHDSKRPAIEARSAADATSPDPRSADALMADFHEALSALELSETHPSVMSSPHNAMAAALQSWIAEEAPKAGRVEELQTGVLEAKFDHNDWAGWTKSFFSWFSGITKASFVPPSSLQKFDSNKLRIALFGDWGTGMYGAPLIAQAIPGMGAFDAVVHLGDVYYAGTKDEERNRALGIWPAVQDARNYSLNSNHEMYSGGHGYFEVLLPDKRFGWQKGSSCFAFMTDHFVFLGLDTGYTEHDITSPELAWIADVFVKAERRKAVFLSHHQPFSSLDVQGPKLQAKLGKYLGNHQVFAWYWGHEHRCVIYDKQPTWGMYGRCVGHAGFPEFRGMIPRLPVAPGQDPCWKTIPGKIFSPPAIVLDGPNPYIADDPDKYLPHGFMTLEIDADTITEYVHDATGKVLYSGLLTAPKE